MTGDELKKARKALGLTQGQLAQLIGMAGPAQIGRIEQSLPGIDGKPRRVSGQVQAAVSMLEYMREHGMLKKYAEEKNVRFCG